MHYIWMPYFCVDPSFKKNYKKQLNNKEISSFVDVELCVLDSNNSNKFCCLLDVEKSNAWILLRTFITSLQTNGQRQVLKPQQISYRNYQNRQFYFTLRYRQAVGHKDGETDGQTNGHTHKQKREYNEVCQTLLTKIEIILIWQGITSLIFYDYKL